MKETIIIIVLGSLIIACTATDCDDTKPLPDIERRARNYQADGELGGDPWVDDEYTGPDWFNVGDYRMPDSRTKPTFKWCGTKQPIYIEGTHPDVDKLNDMPVTVGVCEVNPIDDCSNNWNIEVRKCGDDIHYYLRRTGQQSAYCLDPPDIHNKTDFDRAPDVQINTLRVAPTLALYTANGNEFPYLRFDCIESPAVDRSSLNILYGTYWFVESTLTKHPERINQFLSINETELTDKGYKLGFLIRCGIRVSTSITGIETAMVSSSDFFAGVTVEPSVLRLSTSESAQITLQPTVPFGCYYELNKTPPSTSGCKHKIIMQIPADAKDQCVISETDTGSLPLSQTLDIQAKCGAQIKGFYPYDIRNADSLVMPPAYMTITLPFISYSPTTTKYRLSLTTQDNGIHELWKNALLTEVQVNIITDNSKYKMKTCYAHTDPHIWTSDGRSYKHNSFGGDFIMYQHTRYTSIQVQMRTIRCNGNRAYCPCAVAVRSGGDVFLINICNGSKFIKMTSCVDGGALVVRKQSEYIYEVRTYIGTLITLTILSRNFDNVINIDFEMAPKDYGSTRGLCGTFDGNKYNDYHDRKGNTVNNETTFIRQWELTKDDINLLEPTCELPVSAWNASEYGLYCTCNCSTKEGSCKTIETTAVCSPSQYLKCVIDHLATSKMCKSHAERCSATKKRSSFYIDPEVEMKRKAALAHKPHSNIVKREATGTEKLTEDAARTYCTNTIETKILTGNEHLLGNFNVSQIIEDCTFDVFQGQDPGWAIIHKESADTVIQVAYKLDSNYTSSHEDDFKALKTQACPYNCSGTGVCTEQGICDCFDGYSGPDCGNSKSEGQVIEDVEGGGLCDQRYGSECRCFTIQANFLDELFMCRRERKRVLLNGEIEDIDTHTVNGSYENIYNGECCFDEGRRKRSIDSSTDVQHYQYYVSVSNDGLNFGPQTILYIYDSLCLNVTTDNLGNTFELQTNTCLIDGDCYYETETDFTDACNKCIPETNLFNWTYDCSNSPTEEPPEDSPVEYPEDGQIHGIIIAVCATTGLLLVVLLSIAVVVCIMKRNKNNREYSPSLAFTNGLKLMSSREQSKAVFYVKELTN